MNVPPHIETYADSYDAGKFLRKLGRTAKKLGAKAVYYALILFFAVGSPNISSKDKALILGALGYFLLPVDLIPDFIPSFGFTDDIAALAFVLYKVARNITPDVKSKAESKIYQWFGDVSQEDLKF